MKLYPDTSSYMQLCLNSDDQAPLYLFVPTYWDESRKQYLACVRLVQAKKLILGRGSTSPELEQDFNNNLRNFMENPKTADEAFSLFKPLSYWEEMRETTAV